MTIDMTAEIWDTIFDEIATTQKSVGTICAGLGFSIKPFYLRIVKDDKLLARYEHAKAEQSERLVEKLTEITEKAHKEARDPSIDSDTKRQIMNVYRMERDDIKWIASKLKCKKYGDKQEIDHNIKSVDEIQVTVVDPKNKPKTGG